MSGRNGRRARFGREHRRYVWRSGWRSRSFANGGRAIGETHPDTLNKRQPCWHEHDQQHSDRRVAQHLAGPQGQEQHQADDRADRLRR